MSGSLTRGASYEAHSPFRYSCRSAWIALAALTVVHRFTNNDLWWHLKMGQIIWTTHSIPTTEIFSHTAAGYPWIPHEWLAQLSIYAAYHWYGYSGLMLWFETLAALFLVLVYLLSWLYSGNAKVSLLGGLIGWFFGTVGLAIRPLLIGHVFLVLELLLLELGRTRDRRWLWGLPPLFAVWVNCHASCSFGMMILLVTIACSLRDLKIGPIIGTAWAPGKRRVLIAAFAASGLALFCNPMGWRVITYPLNALFLQHTGLSSVQEWLPLPILDTRAIGMILIMVGLGLGVAAKVVQLRLEEAVLLASRQAWRSFINECFSCSESW